jgi:hypothetical protein
VGHTRRELDKVFADTSTAGTWNDPCIPVFSAPALEQKLDTVIALMTALIQAPTANPPTAFTDESITSATGASQTLSAANTARQELVLYNSSNKVWWINPAGGVAAANGTGCLLMNPGDELTLDCTNAVTGIGTSGKTLTVLER